MDLTKFKTNPTLEIEGVIVPLGDAKLRIARLNNSAMAAGYAARIRPYRGTEPAKDVHEGIMVDCLAEFVLLGWEGVENDGKPFPYSLENAKAALSIKDFREFVIDRARDFEEFRDKETRTGVEAVAKN